MARRPNPNTETQEPPNPEAEADLEASMLPAAPAPSMPPAVFGEVSGDVSNDDIILPRLAIAYGVGGLAVDYLPGDLVLNKEHKIASKQERLNTTVLSIRKYWKEVKAYDPDDPAPPRIIATKDEVEAEGKTTDWLDDPARPGRRLMPDYREAATLTLLIEKPEALTCPMFCMDYQDKLYTPALFYVDKTGYTRSAKKVLSAAATQLKVRGLLAGCFALYTDMEILGGNPTVLPNLQLVKLHDEEFISWLKEMFNT